MIFYDTSTATFHGEQGPLVFQSNKGNKMKLYHVYMNVRYGKANSEGVYGLKGGIRTGYFYVQAKNEKEARTKAQKGIDAGIEPHYSSQGGECIPSPNKTTITFVGLECGPYIP